jgi:hypothetical protein
VIYTIAENGMTKLLSLREVVSYQNLYVAIENTASYLRICPNLKSEQQQTSSSSSSSASPPFVLASQTVFQNLLNGNLQFSHFQPQKNPETQYLAFHKLKIPWNNCLYQFQCAISLSSIAYLDERRGKIYGIIHFLSPLTSFHYQYNQIIDVDTTYIDFRFFVPVGISVLTFYIEFHNTIYIMDNATKIPFTCIVHLPTFQLSPIPYKKNNTSQWLLEESCYSSSPSLLVSKIKHIYLPHEEEEKEEIEIVWEDIPVHYYDSGSKEEEFEDQGLLFLPHRCYLNEYLYQFLKDTSIPPSYSIFSFSESAFYVDTKEDLDGLDRRNIFPEAGHKESLGENNIFSKPFSNSILAFSEYQRSEIVPTNRFEHKIKIHICLIVESLQQWKQLQQRVQKQSFPNCHLIIYSSLPALEVGNTNANIFPLVLDHVSWIDSIAKIFNEFPHLYSDTDMLTFHTQETLKNPNILTSQFEQLIEMEYKSPSSSYLFNCQEHEEDTTFFGRIESFKTIMTQYLKDPKTNNKQPKNMRDQAGLIRMVRRLRLFDDSPTIVTVLPNSK